MKLGNLLMGITATIVAGGISSCSNDLSNLQGNGGVSGADIKPVVAPDAIVWSGN